MPSTLLDIETWVYQKLIADTALLALIGSADNLVYDSPNNFNVLPIVSYKESNNASPDRSYFDNVPNANDSSISFDIWVRYDQDTIPIAQAIDAVMMGLLFNRDFSSQVPEPNTKVQHRTMRYTRMATESSVI